MPEKLEMNLPWDPNHDVDEMNPKAEQAEEIEDFDTLPLTASSTAITANMSRAVSMENEPILPLAERALASEQTPLLSRPKAASLLSPLRPAPSIGAALPPKASIGDNSQASSSSAVPSSSSKASLIEVVDLTGDSPPTSPSKNQTTQANTWAENYLTETYPKAPFVVGKHQNVF